MKLVRIKRKDSTVKVEPKALKERKQTGTNWICKDRAIDPEKGCATHVVLYVNPTEALHFCPPGSRKQKPLVPES